MSRSFLNIISSTLWDLFSLFEIMAVIFSIILITAFVIIGLYQDDGLNIAALFGSKRKKNQNIFNEIEERRYLREEDEREQKLYLLTKFNTMVNKLMPTNMKEYVITTYQKIFGDESPQILVGNFIRKKKNSCRRPKKKVGFKTQLEEIEMEV